MEEPKTLENRYRLATEIGRGPMATVYQAVDLEGSQQVVVKVFQSRFQTDPGFAVRFREHLKVLVEIDHKNLLTILDYGLVDGKYYIVMEEHHGLTLRTVIAEQGALSPSQAVHISKQICAAVNVLHEQGLVHRDLKPENVLLLADGLVKVTDVGLTSLLSETGLSKTDVMLTGVGYMSPEQAHGKPVGPVSDIYNIGILLFEMLTGRLPFESSDAWKVVKMHAQETPPSAHDINPKVPIGLSRIVDQALQKESSGRFTSAAEMEMALAELPQSEGFWWHRLPARIKTSEGFSLLPLLASYRLYVSIRYRQLGTTIAATLRRISPSRRVLIVHYLASFLIAFALLFFLSGHLLDGTSQAANDGPKVQLNKTAPEIKDWWDQPPKVPTLLSSMNSTVPRSLLNGQENVTIDPENIPSQGTAGAVPAEATGTGGNLTQASNQGDGEKADKGNDNGKKNGQENKGKDNNNGKGNGNGQDNKGKDNNNGKGNGNGQDNKGKGNNNKGGKKK